MAKKSAPLHILVVDDESLVRWSFAQALGAVGHIVTEAWTAPCSLDMRAGCQGAEPLRVA
jgi:CheY-like chemotaxis protein